jgi:hypothetical protein
VRSVHDGRNEFWLTRPPRYNSEKSLAFGLLPLARHFIVGAGTTLLHGGRGRGIVEKLSEGICFKATRVCPWLATLESGETDIWKDSPGRVRDDGATERGGMGHGN